MCDSFRRSSPPNLTVLTSPFQVILISEWTGELCRATTTSTWAVSPSGDSSLTLHCLIFEVLAWPVGLKTTWDTSLHTWLLFMGIPGSWARTISKKMGSIRHQWIINPVGLFNCLNIGASVHQVQSKLGMWYPVCQAPTDNFLHKINWIMSNSTQVCYPQLEPQSSKIEKQPIALFLECWANFSLVRLAS